ncbi:MAG: hypothetical protein LC750_07535 [Actinobacteria bacterium]|nr:hypothetical protein [Actinomycetota bacterium]
MTAAGCEFCGFDYAAHGLPVCTVCKGAKRLLGIKDEPGAVTLDREPITAEEADLLARDEACRARAKSLDTTNDE